MRPLERAATWGLAALVPGLLLLRPSAFPELQWVLDLLLIACAAALLAGRAPVGLASGASLAAGGLLLASHLAADDAARSLASLSHAARLALALCAGLGLGLQEGAGRRLARAGLLLAVWLSAHAAWQSFVRFPRLLAGETPLAEGLRAQLADGRANSFFLLPSHLAGMLAATILLSAALALARLEAGDRRRALLPVLGLLAGLVGLALAGSLGGALLLGGGAVVFALLSSAGRLRWGIAGGALLVAVSLLALASAQRDAELRRESPALARLANWQTAARLVRERPLLGFGGGAFALEQDRVRPPGSNVTRHAHQVYLEAAAEHGLLALPLFAFFAVRLGRAARRRLVGSASRSDRILAAGLASAAAVLLGHGLLDFGWSDPSWSVLAALVVGACLAGSGAAGLDEGGRVGLSRARAIVDWSAFAALAGVLATGSYLDSRWAADRDAALALVEGGATRTALARLERPRGGPFERGERRALRAELLLREAGAASGSPGLDSAGGPELAVNPAGARGAVREAVVEAAAAVTLSPRRARFRHLHAAALAADGRRLEAYLEAARAALLAPGVDAYRELRDALRPAREPEAALESVGSPTGPGPGDAGGR